MRCMFGRPLVAALVLVAVGTCPRAAFAQSSTMAPRLIWHLTEPSREKLRQVIASKIAEVREGLKNIREKYPNVTPDEIDWRTDFGYFEIAADPTRGDGKLNITEITFKVPSSIPWDSKLGRPEISLGVTGEWGEPEWDGKLKVGFAHDYLFEVKAGGSIDVTLTADDLYDGEWQKPSESMILRGAEDFLSHFDFYIGGAGGAPLPGSGGEANTGVEVSWNLRDRVWNLVAFQQMYDALDNLADAQDYEAKWRQKKIEDEARRVGVDPTGKSVNDLVKAIHEKYDANPGLRRNIFKKNAGTISVSGKVSDWYCTNRPWISVALSLPNLIQTGLADFFKNLPAPPDPPPPDAKPGPK